MKLIERDEFLVLLQTTFENTGQNEGHCILVSGEAGIGKTSLIKRFCQDKKRNYKIFVGTCDALFTPRPLGPLCDILWQMKDFGEGGNLQTKDRAELFTRFLQALEDQRTATVIIIEDIHWADEATLDFIKFLARRITQFHCLFILTYRDNEIHSQQAMRNVIGQIPPDTFTRLRLTPLSRQAVEGLSAERGYNGEEVYSITNGNPFYVNEILASYSPGVPVNIRDSILSVYNRLDEQTKHVLQILSVLPTRFEVRYLKKMEPMYAEAIQNCLEFGILICSGGFVFFKHELYRRTIESSLSPFVRLMWNKKILDLFLKSFEQHGELERIVHHAKNANAADLVVKYAPLAASQAAFVGAHTEASKLYFSAIEYYQGNDAEVLIRLYDAYAYECYLTSQVNEAIIYAGKSLKFLQEGNNAEKTGNCLRFLSWLYSFYGDKEKSEFYATQSIAVLADQPSSRAKAMAYSNMGRLKALWDERDECILWSEKAMAIGNQLNDREILCHARSNKGTILSRNPSSRDEGLKILQQSLDDALKNNYEEHVSYSYVTLASIAVMMKNYKSAKELLEEATRFCEERDLDLGTIYLLIYRARLLLETGFWTEAHHISESFFKNETYSSIIQVGPRVIAGTIRMRKGDVDVLPMLLEAKQRAFKTSDLQKILLSTTALLEYEWITTQVVLEKEDLDYVIMTIREEGNIYENSSFAFWLLKARKQKLMLAEFFEGYRMDDTSRASAAASIWERLGCPYEQALALFEGNYADKRTAIEIIHNLGADAVYEKMKFEMRASGIKKIPRGLMKSTKSNPANLTRRELDILHLLKEGLHNKEIGAKLFISSKTVSHHISAIFFKLDVNSRVKAVQAAIQLEIIK
jgi:DNA-binding CsgD family transcriptional regulator